MAFLEHADISLAIDDELKRLRPVAHLVAAMPEVPDEDAEGV